MGDGCFEITCRVKPGCELAVSFDGKQQIYKSNLTDWTNAKFHFGTSSNTSKITVKLIGETDCFLDLGSIQECRNIRLLRVTEGEGICSLTNFKGNETNMRPVTLPGELFFIFIL